MRTHSTTRMIAPLLLSLLLAILTLACNLIPPSAESLALQTASANLQSTLDKQNDAKTITADAANRHATATEAAQTAVVLLATRRAEEAEFETATADALATATAGPSLNENNAPAGWELKLYDAFEKNTFGWPTGADDSNQWVHEDNQVEDGRYVITTTAKQGFSSYGYPGLSTSRRDCYVMVDADLLSGVPSSSYGLVVALHTATGEFYAFQVTEEGFWSIDLRKESYWAPIQSGRSSLIVSDGNHLAVKATDGDFIFYVNGEQIAIVHDDRLDPLGRAGVIVGANYGGAESTFTFDNFTVLAP